MLMCLNKINITLFIISLVISFSSFGQDKINENPNTDFKRFQIGINISPDICFRTLKNNDGSSTSVGLMKSHNDRETTKISYTTGLNFCFNIIKSISLETGFQYSNKGFQTKMMDLTFSGPPSTTLPTKSKSIYNFHYIDIPIKMNFSFGKNKIGFFTSVGIITNILIKNDQTMVLVYSDKTEKATNPIIGNFKALNLSPIISIGVDYKINERMNLRVEPIFRYGVMKIIDAPVTEYLWNGGLNISYFYGL